MLNLRLQTADVDYSLNVYLTWFEFPSNCTIYALWVLLYKPGRKKRCNSSYTSGTHGDFPQIVYTRINHTHCLWMLTGYYWYTYTHTYTHLYIYIYIYILHGSVVTLELWPTIAKCMKPRVRDTTIYSPLTDIEHYRIILQHSVC